MLKHVSFLTRDLGAVLAFYTRLGGKVEKDLTTHEGHRRGVVRLGEGLVGRVARTASSAAGTVA